MADRFEELVAWQRARALVREVYAVSRSGGFAKDFALARQIQRASVSAMSNIAEGFDRKRDTEFHYFLTIAKGSCSEVRSLLYVALDVRHLDQTSFDRLMLVAEECSRGTAGLRSSLARALKASDASKVRSRPRRNRLVVPVPSSPAQDSGLRTQD